MFLEMQYKLGSYMTDTKIQVSLEHAGRSGRGNMSVRLSQSGIAVADRFRYKVDTSNVIEEKAIVAAGGNAVITLTGCTRSNLQLLYVHSHKYDLSKVYCKFGADSVNRYMDAPIIVIGKGQFSLIPVEDVSTITIFNDLAEDIDIHVLAVKF